MWTVEQSITLVWRGSWLLRLFTGDHINNSLTLFWKVRWFHEYFNIWIISIISSCNCITHWFRCGQGWIWSLHFASEEMALESQNECFAFLTNHPSRSLLWNSVCFFGAEFGRNDWFATGFGEMQENCVFPRKSVDLSSPWSQRARLSVWTQSDHDLVRAFLRASIVYEENIANHHISQEKNTNWPFLLQSLCRFGVIQLRFQSEFISRQHQIISQDSIEFPNQRIARTNRIEMRRSVFSYKISRNIW